MRLLLDTHLLLWAASRPECNDYVELPITGQHVAAVAPLPLPLPIRYDRRSGKRRAGGAGHTGGT